MTRFCVVGNPGNRRVTLFARAVRAAGLPAPVVVPWARVAAGRVAVPEGSWVRVDSPGEDAEVAGLLAGTSVDPYRVEGSAAWYQGFRSALARLRADVTGAPGARLLNDPDDIAVMFDKRRCHAVLRAAGVRVPPALPPVTCYGELRERMRAAGMPRVFVKPAHGSSASGVVALAAHGRRVRAVTSVELAGTRLYNSLRVRAYEDEGEVETVIDRLCADRVHVERWLPKASLGGKVVDLRVLVVAGRPTHAVVRASTTPMTNLHLGNARGDLTALRDLMGERAWTTAMDTCVRAAACFPGSLHVGVDLLVSANGRRHAVAEVNAFGDLLPGLEHQGRDTYAEQVDAVLTGRFRCST